jgi:glyoxylase-like metal-dependent hydrolase (beta-lactamase superfamily II)
MSVVTGTGDAFVGDLAFNCPVLSRKSKAPPFGDSLERIGDSWWRLLQMGVRRIFPAHGRPFPADALWPLPKETQGKENAHGTR